MPSWRVTSKASGESCARHSASVFTILSTCETPRLPPAGVEGFDLDFFRGSPTRRVAAGRARQLVAMKRAPRVLDTLRSRIDRRLPPLANSRSLARPCLRRALTISAPLHSGRIASRCRRASVRHKSGRPWLHWPAPGVVSISRNSAFISAGEEAAAGAHGMMAGAGREHMVELARQAARVAVLGKKIGDVFDEPLASISPKIAGVSRTSAAPGPKGSTREPSAASSSTRRRSAFMRVVVEIDDDGDEQRSGAQRPSPRAGASASHRRGAHGRRAGRR